MGHTLSSAPPAQIYYATNCTHSYLTQPDHEPKLHHIAIHKQKLRPPRLLTSLDILRISHRSRSAKGVLWFVVGQQHVFQAPQQEERVCAEAVKEYDPADPRATETDPVGQVGDEQRHDDVDELVAAVCDEVEELRGAADGEEEGAGSDDEDLE